MSRRVDDTLEPPSFTPWFPPTAVTTAEVKELLRLAKGTRVLEIGALLGFSTINLASVAELVVSVDPHEGYPSDDPKPTLAPFLANLERVGVRDKVVVCVGRDADVLPVLERRSFGFAFIDCDGTFETTRDAILRCEPLLRHSAALAVHDCGHPDWPGALAAVEAYAKLRGTTFKLVDRLAVFEQTWGSWQTRP